jgi:hypothetical protein
MRNPDPPSEGSVILAEVMVGARMVPNKVIEVKITVLRYVGCFSRDMFISGSTMELISG